MALKTNENNLVSELGGESETEVNQNFLSGERNEVLDHGDVNEGPSEKRFKDEERAATEKVLNALLSYRRFGRSCIRRRWNVFQKLPLHNQLLLTPSFQDNIKQMRHCVEENYRFIQAVIAHGVSMFGDDASMREAVKKAQTTWSVSEHYMSKVKSTLKQFVREWSSQGEHERKACYSVMTEALCKYFPEKERRHVVNVMVPGAGLGRLAWDLIQQGFSVQGNEFSLFMLLGSNYVLNRGLQVNEVTIYPYVLETCNSWSYEDQLRPVSFPDVALTCDFAERLNNFSMCAGDFLLVTKNDDCYWSAVVTAFFIDTAYNVIDYIDTVYRILKVGGVWINYGPLTYHFTDSDGSLELPYDEIIRLIKKKGFKFERDERVEASHLSLYASNYKSMLRYEYHCGFFECVKLADPITQSDNS